MKKSLFGILMVVAFAAGVMFQQSKAWVDIKPPAGVPWRVITGATAGGAFGGTVLTLLFLFIAHRKEKKSSRFDSSGCIVDNSPPGDSGSSWTVKSVAGSEEDEYVQLNIRKGPQGRGIQLTYPQDKSKAVTLNPGDSVSLGFAEDNYIIGSLLVMHRIS